MSQRTPKEKETENYKTLRQIWVSEGLCHQDLFNSKDLLGSRGGKVDPTNRLDPSGPPHVNHLASDILAKGRLPDLGRVISLRGSPIIG